MLICAGAPGRSPREALCQSGTQRLLARVPLQRHPAATRHARVPHPHLDIKEIDLIVSPLKQAFNSILWGLKTLLNN